MIQQQVMEFHRAFGAAINQPFEDDLDILRFNLIREEFDELTKALLHPRPDRVEVADALGDLAYVVYGAAIAYGIDLDAVVTEIHRSNMTKLGDNGKPVYRDDGKVLKGPGYEPPDLAPIVNPFTESVSSGRETWKARA